ncbi:MAG: acyl-CoA dehydrogenase [Pseudomonadota bacterium]
MDFISREDLSFLLHDWLRVGNLTDRPHFSEHSRETFDQILDLSADFARDVFAPHFKAADINEPQFVDGQIVIVPEVGQALEDYAEAGFFASAFPEALGGTGLPMVVSAASFAHFCAANIATSGYPMLTAANARLLVEHGSPSQIDAWALPQIAGQYFGTMCLSEPQAGSSLADVRTQAQPDGEDDFGHRYRLRGNKMWISGGDHDMSENIVHLVLAKAPGDDGVQIGGTKGISLFLVPKFLPDGTRNDVAVAGLNHKMGYRGTVNCLLNFGEEDGAIGWRVGDIGDGLAIMFQMMNEARIMVGLGAAALAYRGFTQSLDYARERPQGRLPVDRGNPSSRQRPIIEHADVKRMLMSQKAIAEGAMALVLFSAKLADEEKTADSQEKRAEASALLGLLTPITKSWPSEFGLIANDHAIQIHGGYGYTREYDVEQIYRDNRLNPIHEGTNGIQGLDFLGRKILGDDGAAFALLRSRIEATIAVADRDPNLSQMALELCDYMAEGGRTLDKLQQSKSDPAVLDNASYVLSAFGHLVVAWLWLEQAITASTLDDGRREMREAKLATCRFFFECELPKVSHLFSLSGSMNRAASAVPLSVFG